MTRCGTPFHAQQAAVQLVQVNSCTASQVHQCHQWVDDVFSRPAGALPQEVGGVDMHAEADTELARISQPETMSRIRAKHAGKPKYAETL